MARLGQRPGILGSLIRVVLLVLAVASVAGSRFRYGSISWEHDETKEPSSADKFWVKFYLRTQFRRAFLWGTAFREQWAYGAYGKAPSDSSVSWLGSEVSRESNIKCNVNDITDDKLNAALFGQCYSCSTNMAGSGSQADFAEHWGCTPLNAFPPASTAAGTAYNFFVKFTAKRQEYNGYSEFVRVCSRPFQCDHFLVEETKIQNSQDYNVTFTSNPNPEADYCDQNLYENDTNWQRPNQPCAPWHEVYGFYTGDSARENYAADVVMKSVDYDKCFNASDKTRPTSCSEPGFRNQAMGDYLSLEGEVSVQYTYQKSNQDAPYVAFFTGGDRLYSCAYAHQNTDEFPGFDDTGACLDTENEFRLTQSNWLLRNNAEGRYRLETTVFLMAGDSNKSPFMMMPPLIVLPSRPLGTPVTFTVPAYDPDGDSIVFRMGNHREYGGSIRSKVNAFPWAGIFQRLTALNQTLPGSEGEMGYVVNASSPYKGMMKPMPRTDTPSSPQIRQLGNFGCNLYDITVLEKGECSTDRVAGKPLGSTVLSNGLVEWHAWQASTPTGPKACTSASDSGCSRLGTGLYNFVVMAEEQKASGVGVKVPVDFLVYLYDGTVSFCGDNCMNVPKNNNRGVPTFVDRDGEYGAEVRALTNQEQSCKICNFNGASKSCDPDSTMVPSACTCSLNTPPQFYQSPTEEHDNLLESPLLKEWKAWAAGDGSQVEIPRLIYYKGETVEFYVSAYDVDDCAEVYIEATSLPYGPGAIANLSDAIYETKYPSDIPVAYPKGQFVRKKFAWAPQQYATYQNDTRPDSSLVCFTASDKYLYHTYGTNSNVMKPYCFEIRLLDPPPVEEETIYRFDWDTSGTCSDPKLAIHWHPVIRRYAIVDQGTRYWTKCKFESFMWHHTFMTVGDDRMARLYVDGELQELMKEVGLNDADQSTYDKGIDIGTEVEIVAYANKCKARPPLAPYWWSCSTSGYANCPAVENEAADRRKLLGMFDGQELEGNLSYTTDYPVTDGYRFDYDMGLQYVTEPGLALPTGDCCGFRIGADCPGESSYFDGFIDEVVVYNRQVSQEDIKTIMFKMPQYLPERELEAPRGVQHDVTAGRVLWARFNNPCMEGPIPQAQADQAPRVGGRRLQQITSPGRTIYHLISTDAANNTGRRSGVSDKAGMTAGGAYSIGDDDFQIVMDLDDDRLNFINGQGSYAYTGVPWLAPTISSVDYERVPITTENPLPLDGGIQITLAGVGFARSPWLKCVAMQPDIRAKFETEVLKQADTYKPRNITDASVYDMYFKDMSHKKMLIESKAWSYEGIEGVQFAGADTLFEPDEWSPYLLATSTKHPQNKHKTVYDPDCTVPSRDPVTRCAYNDILGWENAPTCAFCPDVGAIRIDWKKEYKNRAGNAPAYEKMPNRDNLLKDGDASKYFYTLWDDFIYGGWEKVVCSVPSAAFPSDHYYVGVSNDGGMTGSPATAKKAETVTFTEYALELDGSQYLALGNQAANGRTFSLWFMPKSLSGMHMLLNLTRGVGIGMQDGKMYAFSSNSQVAYPKDGNTPLSVTAGEWHHAALMLTGDSTLKFYVDGVEVLSDGVITRDSTSDFPAVSAIGYGFVGFIDEVKVDFRAKTGSVDGKSEMYLMMWNREKRQPDSNNVRLYLRFNAPSAAKDASGKQKGLMDSSGNARPVSCMPSDGSICSFSPVPVPWEPTSIYEINDVGPSVFSFPMTGGAPLKVKGFNFAPSKWLKCGWGRKMEGVVVPTNGIPQAVDPAGTCPYKVGSLNSVYGKPDQLQPYDAFQFTNGTATYTNATVLAFSSWSKDYLRTMELNCSTPVIDADVYYMAAAGPKFLNSFIFEITDVSLYCNGSTYMTANSNSTTAVLASSSKGYTFMAWVLPFSMPAGPAMGPPRVAASDKLGHRRTYLPNEKPEQTIFAMENRNGTDVKHAGLLMYDGVRFVYYDDCILDVTSTLELGSRPDEWHFVAVRIDENGEGDLFVDGIMIEHFTTVCKPEITTSMSLCMDDDKMGRPSSFFHGLVDEVKLVSQSLSESDLLKYMFNQKAHQELTRNVAYYTFDSCLTNGANTTIPPAMLLNAVPTLQPFGPPLDVKGATCSQGQLLVSSSGPWRPARLIAQSDISGGITGQHRLRVVGANLAVSQWLGVTFDGKFSPAIEMEGPNVMIVNTPEVSSARVLEEKLANWAGAAALTNTLPAVSADDTRTISLKGSVQDLGTGLEAYYTFDAAGTDKDIMIGDQPISGADAVFDFAGSSRHGAVERNMHASDRDGYKNGAVLIGEEAVGYVPAPATYMNLTQYTVCAWIQLSFGIKQASTTLPDQMAPLYGAWKMYCLVKNESSTKVYVNTEPTASANVSATFMEVFQGFMQSGIVLYGLPSTAAIDDMWIYSRALAPTEIIARYYTNSIAIDFGKPAFDRVFGLPRKTEAVDPMSPDYSVDLPWPMDDPFKLAKLLSATGPGMSMMSKLTWMKKAMTNTSMPHQTQPVTGTKSMPARMSMPMNVSETPKPDEDDMMEMWDAGMPDMMEVAMGAPVVVTNLTIPIESPVFTAWIYPWSTDNTELTTIFADSKNLWSFGLRGQRLTFSAYIGCPCEPCSQYNEIVSWQARVLPRRWTHIAVRYDTEPMSPIPGNNVTLYIDGLLMDKKVFTEYGAKPLMSTNTASVGSAMDGSGRFDGLIYSVGVHSDFVPWEIKREVQCPQTTPEDLLLFLGGSKASSFGSRLSFVMGVAPDAASAMLVGRLPASAYANATFDDPTVAEAIEITGDDHFHKFSGYDGDYIITTRTACGKKRVYGGELIGVKMMYIKESPEEANFTTDKLVSVTDGHDGNYHVSYTGLQCGTYNTSVTLGSELVGTYQTVIKPSPTSPMHSKVETKQTGACFGNYGVVQTLDIRAYDAFGCIQDTDVNNVTVSIRGPADIVVTATYVGYGRYRAKFVPPAPGKYFVEIKLTNGMYLTPVDFTDTPYQCIDICAGHALEFKGGLGSVQTTASVTAAMDEAMDDGEITMEAWIKPKSPFIEGQTYALFKGTIDEANRTDYEGPIIKGYSLGVRKQSFPAELMKVTARVYVGLGEYLTLEADFPWEQSKWLHIAATFNGTDLKLFRNGVVVKTLTTPSRERRRVHQNMYGHPLSIGYEFRGEIDEVTVWKRALSDEEVKAKMYCPKFLDMDDVVIYLPFNEEGGAKNFAAFGGPAGSGEAPFMPYATNAVVNVTSVGFDLIADTPMYDLVSGVGVPGSRYSIISPGGEVVAGDFDSVVLNLQAFDQCGFHHIGKGQGDFRLQLTRHYMQYYDTRDPISDGVPMYPIVKFDAAMAPVDARGLPGTCYAASPAPPYYRGDMFEVVGEAVVAGKYKAKVTTRDGKVLQDKIDVEVHARLGDLAEVIIMPIPETEAGVSAAIRFHLMDGFDNIIMDDHSDNIKVSIFSIDTANDVDTVSPPWFDKRTGEYLVSFLSGAAGEHRVNITVALVNRSSEETFSKSRPAWRQLLTADSEVPEGTVRFEHGGVSDPETGDLYVWGGAGHDKSYLSDMWTLRAIDPAVWPKHDMLRGGMMNSTLPLRPTVLAYSKTITITSAKALPDATVIEVTLNTESLITAGKLHHGCNDLYFTLPNNGDFLFHYVDTFKSRACGTTTTVVHVKIPGGLLMASGTMQIEVYYGEPGHFWPNPFSKPQEIFAFYEGFENGNAGMLRPVEPCTQEPSNSTAFKVELFEEAYSGMYALHALEGAKGVLKAAMLGRPLDSFLMRAWFYDANAHEAAHYISPDYSDCGMTAGADMLLPDGGPLTARSTAVGVYTLSARLKYCVSSPWQSSGLTTLRSAAWHRLEVTSTPQAGLSVSVDGQVIKTADPIMLDKVLLSTGYSADGVGHDFLSASHAYFDEISVVELNICGKAPCLSVSVPAAERGVVKYVEDVTWEKVMIDSGSAPPARYGHSVVPFDGGMVIFGGERSSYAFNDVWFFSFQHQAWVYLPPKSATAPPPRFDHAATITNGMMYVSGGRSGTGEVYNDLWVFDLETRMWTELAGVGKILGARFGHAAAFGPSGNYLYMFGGFLSQPAGFSSSFFRCRVLDGLCQDISNGCPNVTTDSGSRVLGVGLTARTGHTMLPTGNGVIVFGGSDDSSIELIGAYSFSEATCSWSLLNIASGEVQGSTRVIEDLARHDHAAMKMLSWMAVQGGVKGGAFMNSVHVLATP